jgi:peptidoglycan/LPS O-acetylase OafA/YrhL
MEQPTSTIRTFELEKSKAFENLTAVRIFLASIVTLSHCYPLTGTREPLAAYAKNISGGEIGVIGFFFISGYLVTQSYQRDSIFFHFLYNRFLRIWPAFIVALFSGIFLASFANQATPGVFFNEAKKYFSESLLIINGVRVTIPQVFNDLPNPAINGSLWTLPSEVRLYLFVAILGVSGILLKRRTLNLVLLCVFTFLFLNSEKFLEIWKSANALVIFPVVAFLLGMGACMNVGENGRKRIALLLYGLAILSLVFGEMRMSYTFIICCVVFYVGFCPTSFHLPCKHDISYGIDIYSFPIQQFIIWKSGIRSPLFLFLTAFPIICLLSFLSWKFVEKPFLNLKFKRAK